MADYFLSYFFFFPFNLHLVKPLYSFPYLALGFKLMFCVCVVQPFYFCFAYPAPLGEWRPQIPKMVQVGRDLKAHLIAPSAMGRDMFHYPRVLQALSNLAFNCSRGGNKQWYLQFCPGLSGNSELLYHTQAALLQSFHSSYILLQKHRAFVLHFSVFYIFAYKQTL